MRFALALALVGSMVGSAAADPGTFDPFDHRAPSAEPGPSTQQPAPAPHDEVLDPGRSQRLHAKLFLAGGVSLLGATFALNLYWRHKYDEALTGPYLATDIAAANRYHDESRYLGSGLFFAGAAAVGVATYLYFTAPDRIRHTVVTPMVSSDQAGVSFAGAF